MIQNYEILGNQLSNNEVQINQQIQVGQKQLLDQLISLEEQEQNEIKQLNAELQALNLKKKQLEQTPLLPGQDIFLELLSDQIKSKKSQKILQENIYHYFKQNLKNQIQIQEKTTSIKKDIAEMKNKQKTLKIVLFWIGAAALVIILVLSVLITFNQKYAFLPPDAKYWIRIAILICGLIFLSVYFVSNWPH